jgi:hypothetical protein
MHGSVSSLSGRAEPTQTYPRTPRLGYRRWSRTGVPRPASHGHDHKVTLSLTVKRRSNDQEAGFPSSGIWPLTCVNRVDLVSAYSKRSGLLVDLDHAAQQLGQANSDTGTSSVRSTERVGGAHSLQDRLTDADMRQIIMSFQGGTPRYKIAAQYGISVRSVGRLLRKWQDNLP